MHFLAFMVNTLLFFYFGFTFFFRPALSLISDSRHYSKMLLSCSAAGSSVGVTGGAGVAATVESGGAPAAHCFCSPMQNVQPRQFLAVFFVFLVFFSYSAYQLCEQEVQQWCLEEPAEECWQLRQCPAMGSRHATVQERLFGPLMVRRLSYLTCHWALPRFTSAAVQVFDCQESSFSAGAQAAVQWSDNRRLVDGWSE